MTKMSHDEEDSISYSSTLDDSVGCRMSRRCKLITCTVSIGIPLAVVAGLLIGALINTAFVKDPFQRVGSPPSPAEEDAFVSPNAGEAAAMAERLADAIAFRTISYEAKNLSLDELSRLNDYLDATYAELHQADYVEYKTVNGHSRLYRVQGSDVSRKDPYLLCAHLDVVPEGQSADWLDHPFDAGVIANGTVVYGRGAIDDKHSVLGILEALNHRVKLGMQPTRTFYLAFGHDEEVDGNEGAAHLAVELKKLLESRGENLAFILDEGMFVMEEVVPGVSDALIYVGVGEKGQANVRLEARGPQGHSSAPPKESAVGALSEAAAGLSRRRHPSKFGQGVEVDTVRYAAPHASFFYRFAMGNLWLLSPAVSWGFAADADADAVQRTTGAVTIVQAGVKKNVVPGEAEALINHRIHPADDVADVLERDKKFAGMKKSNGKGDVSLSLTLEDYLPASPTSPYDNDAAGFQAIAGAALDVYPAAHPVPGLMVANTDTRHYWDLCDAIYRFTPAYLVGDETAWFHGVDEQISVEKYVKVIEFYYRLMDIADKQGTQ